MSTLKYTTISKESFLNILARYPSAALEKLRDLDALRYDEIPATLAQRSKDNDAHLTKEEVEKLVEWKLPASIPFFSDEVFRWMMWDDSGKPTGWDRPIKYNAKEYEEVVKRVGEVRVRLGAEAVDVEKVAWVMGREGVDVGVDNEDADGEVGVRRAERSKEVAEETAGEKEKVVIKELSKKGVKRQGSELKASTEGKRRSSRRKMAM
ncbi:hypothetical protein N0V90_008211 [Kalmusia sp. IMI 367209]|nr:hypothetical protein N0V90_008211 [Kalmusia sp. IMI 367209]